MGWFALTAKPEYDAEKVEKEVRAVISARQKVAPDDKQALGSFNAKKEFSKMQTLFMGIRALIWFVGVFTLLAGVVGVANIMLIVVKERTKRSGSARPWAPRRFRSSRRLSRSRSS